MRKRGLPMGILLPAGLVLLVGTLATLQYRWLGQVSEAEREELSRSVEQRAQEFADDFDLELSRAYLAFQLGDDPVTASEASGIERRLASWRAVARYPDLLGDVYLARAEPERYTLFRYDAAGSSWQSVEWPAALEPVHLRLMPQVTQTTEESKGPITRQITLSTSPLVREVPALLIPVTGSNEAPASAPVTANRIFQQRTSDLLLSLGLRRDFLIVELNRPYLETVMLPAVADRFFGENTGARYRVSVVDAEGRALLTRGLPAGQSIDESKADVSRRFFGVRLDLARPPTPAGVFTWQAETTETRGGAGARMKMPADGRMSIVVARAEGAARGELLLPSQAGWHLLVQHAAGSLDAAVAAARRRNLWLSFGILSVLAASVGLIVLNARRSERLAAQQMDFVATVSHELRTPLAVIRSAAQNLAAGVVHEPDQARRYGALIETEGRRLTDMVEQVLEFAGLSGNRGLQRARPVDPGGLVRDTMEASAGLCRDQGITLDVTVAPDLPLVEGDEDAVRRALDNLVTNALKYGADGRWIGVSATRGTTSSGTPEVRIAVSDRGRGIDAADLDHIFEPFYRGRHALERQIHGNGLGLSLVSRIAEAHGGRVTVTSSRGQGTTFTIHLPGIAPDTSVQPIGHPAADIGPRV